MSIASTTNTWTADAKISSSSSSRSSNLVSLVSNSGGDSIISAILMVLSSGLLSVSLVRQGSAPPDDVYIDDVNYCYRGSERYRLVTRDFRAMHCSLKFHYFSRVERRSVRFNGASRILLIESHSHISTVLYIYIFFSLFRCPKLYLFHFMFVFLVQKCIIGLIYIFY